MRTKCIVALFILFLSTACALSTPPSPAVTPAQLMTASTPTERRLSPTHAPAATFTPPLSPIASPTSTLTPTSRPTVTLTASPTPLTETIEAHLPEAKGSIWVYLEKKGYYLIIDLSNRQTSTVEGPPYLCRHDAIGNTFQVLCKRTGQNYYLYDLITKEIQELPGEQPEWIYAQASGVDLLYGYREHSSNLSSLFAYNMTTALSETVISGLNFEDNTPALSMDNENLLVFRYSSGFSLIDLATGEASPIIPEQLTATPNYAWSPTASMFAFGATDLHTEIGLYANYLYLYDVGSGQIQLLSQASHRYDEFGWPVWSPDGTQIVTLAINVVCIVNVGTRDETCGYPDNPGEVEFLVNRVTWSPDSQYIAFLQLLDMGPSIPKNLIVYDPIAGEFIPLLQNEYISGLFWR